MVDQLCHFLLIKSVFGCWCCCCEGMQRWYRRRWRHIWCWRILQHSCGLGKRNRYGLYEEFFLTVWIFLWLLWQLFWGKTSCRGGSQCETSHQLVFLFVHLLHWTWHSYCKFYLCHIQLLVFSPLQGFFVLGMVVLKGTEILLLGSSFYLFQPFIIFFSFSIQ